MGACFSLDYDERKARARSEHIDKQLQQDLHRNTINILLLGAGESGKSTLVKQMKIIHNDGFSESELLSFKTTVLENLLFSMKYVLNGMGVLRINLDNPKNKIHAQTVLSCGRCYDERRVMLPFISNAIRCLWQDRGVRVAVQRGFEYELNDSAIYYFDHMSRICSEKFKPTQVDVLRARVRTSSIIETAFSMNGFVFRLFDVGGQRTERRKWIQCFDNVRAVLFVAALSGYDMTLFESPSINRLDESLRLFKQITNNIFFEDTSTVLFLNKLDIFREKILHSGRHLRYYFPDYSFSDYDVDSAAFFIQNLFLWQAGEESSKVIYPHFTTATDTGNVQVVFEVCMQTIIRDNIKHAQLL